MTISTKKNLLLLILIWLTQSSILSSQTSPVEWLNSSYNINVDTTQKSQWGNYENCASSANDLRFTFKNTGNHVTFIDTVNFCEPFITKPFESSTVLLSSYLIDYTAVLKKRDTTMYVMLPFYYEGKIFREKLSVVLTFGKSKLIAYDNFKVDITDRVAEIVVGDTLRATSLDFVHYIKVKNINNKPIYVPNEFVAFNDAPQLKNYGKPPVKLLPNETYNIPVKLRMDKKHRFTCKGDIEIYSDDVREVFRCEIVSKYGMKNDSDKK